jgi:hypothetical protein
MDYWGSITGKEKSLVSVTASKTTLTKPASYGMSTGWGGVLSERVDRRRSEADDIFM